MVSFQEEGELNPEFIVRSTSKIGERSSSPLYKLEERVKKTEQEITEIREQVTKIF